MRISDWSSDVCSSDLAAGPRAATAGAPGARHDRLARWVDPAELSDAADEHETRRPRDAGGARADGTARSRRPLASRRSDRQSVVSGKSVSVRVDLGCRRIIKTTSTLDKK